MKISQLFGLHVLVAKCLKRQPATSAAYLSCVFVCVLTTACSSGPCLLFAYRQKCTLRFGYWNSIFGANNMSATMFCDLCDSTSAGGLIGAKPPSSACFFLSLFSFPCPTAEHTPTPPPRLYCYSHCLRGYQAYLFLCVRLLPALLHSRGKGKEMQCPLSNQGIAVPPYTQPP